MTPFSNNHRLCSCIGSLSLVAKNVRESSLYCCFLDFQTIKFLKLLAPVRQSKFQCRKFLCKNGFPCKSHFLFVQSMISPLLRLVAEEFCTGIVPLVVYVLFSSLLLLLRVRFPLFGAMHVTVKFFVEFYRKNSIV